MMTEEYIEDIVYNDSSSYYTVIQHIIETRTYYNDYLGSIMFYLEL